MNKSEKFWNRLSKNYDKQAKDKTYEMILDKAKKRLKHDDIVLDFACATGLYSFEIANIVKEIHAFDISSKMIDVANIKARNNEIDNIHFSQTTIFDEKFRKETFDTILALNILLYFEDVQKVIQRMYELLKPGGLIITSTACLGEKRTFIGILSSSIVFILTKMRILPYLRFFKKHELEKTISANGFKIIETDVLVNNPATEYFIIVQKVKK